MPEASSLRRNLEIKAKLRSLADARRQAQAIADRQLPGERQTDTYFHCTHGRLKLREIQTSAGTQSLLISYHRPDQPSSKTSDYYLVPVSDPQLLKAALSAALGVRQVVAKRREIYLWQNVRIHLDAVAGLGEFLELEAVIGAADDEAASPGRIAHLTEHFGILPGDLLPASYADLLGRQG
jgi:predicted adenylyl cyclase CyaB